jgi:ATP-dependent DNA helicase RecG
MPSALENLIKILKQEREEGCKDKVVMGGLKAYSQNWKDQAQQEARHAEQYALAEEFFDLMQSYDALPEATQRLERINYMLDRLVQREPLPEAYQKYLAEAEEFLANRKPSRPDNRRQERSSRKDRDSERSRSGSGNSSKKGRDGGNNRSRSSFNEDDLQALDDPSIFEQSNSTGELDIPQQPRLQRPPLIQRQALSPEEAQERLQALQQPLTTVKGIGDSKSEMIALLGIETITEMLQYLPRRYDDYTRLAPIRRLEPDQVQTVIGTVEKTEVRVGRNNRKDFHATIVDDTGRLALTFFGQHFLIRTIKRGQQIVVSGKVTIYRQLLQMTNPEWEFVDSENLHAVGIVPVYSLTEGVKARFLRRTMKTIVDNYTDSMPDHLPIATLERCELADYGWTLRHLHFPAGFDHLHHARRRYVFDQLVTLQLAVLTNRHEWQSEPGFPLEVEDGFLERFIENAFPYELTRAQRRAIDDIRRDVTSTTPMNRLIQGDVGSGKTAVATVAMAMAIANGKQAAIMAPTSILAEQHYRGLSEIFAQMTDYQPVIALLTGALTKSERESIYRGLADGSIDVVVGTHALIQEGVNFNELAVAVIDEQHRFGVEQRARLRGKSNNPHLLVMTATPIPRTLALTMYADLDLSIIDEKPPGRQPVQTRIVQPKNRERAYSFVEAQLEQGRQAFIIHPLVEASESIQARSAMEAYEELQHVFHRYRVCLLHGRMRPDEKDEVMHAFANHEYDVMVTTSVAEVGVNIPNANIIVIEGANRFGLAQLHQFRGRVGRGDHKSFCLLFADNSSFEAYERLQALESTDDGFVLAERDWQLRGAGDLLGTRQSGTFIFQLGDFVTQDLVELAQSEARTIYEDDPELIQPEHYLLKMRVLNLQMGEGGDVS